MSQHPTERGQLLYSGRLYRRISNTDGCWNPQCGLPRNGAFVPRGRNSDGTDETGISSYLVTMTSPADVLAQHDAFGLAIINIEELYCAVELLRRDPKVKAFSAFGVRWDPLPDSASGSVEYAHVYIDPVPKVIQKELARLTSPSRIVKPVGVMKPNTGSGTVTS